jgi:hypothetical protein
MDFQSLKNEYMNQMNCAEYLDINPNFACVEYRKTVAHKMLYSLATDTGRHDYLKYNDAMRRAARKFGYKKTALLKDALKQANVFSLV